MKMKNDCLFCKIINQEIPSHRIYEDNDIYAFLDIEPASNGHILVVPKEHSVKFSTTKPEIVQKTVLAAQKITNQLAKSLAPQGFNFLINENEIAGQKIMHFHFHIIPKYTAESGLMTAVIKDKLMKLNEVAQKIKS